MTKIEELNEKIKNCKLCPLHKNRTNAVPGEGPKDAEVFLVGEAPGQNEDKEGRPFVGNAGEILTDLLEDKADLDRKEVFIGNVLKCRPPENRDPEEDEIEACSPYLKKQIRKIEPKLIISLGRFAARLFLEKSVKISKTHGQVKDIEYGGWNCKLFISYHPAAALYGGQVRGKLEEDFSKVGEVLEDLDNFSPSKQTKL